MRIREELACQLEVLWHVLRRGTQEIVGVMRRSAMDGDERTAGMSSVARVDAVRPVFAQARAIADGASPAELPPISCP